jgi:hypothetical protein
MTTERMRLKLEGPLDTEDQLRTDLGVDDVGRTWWIGFVWYMWTGEGWQKAIATQGARKR